MAHWGNGAGTSSDAMLRATRYNYRRLSNSESIASSTLTDTAPPEDNRATVLEKLKDEAERIRIEKKKDKKAIKTIDFEQSDIEGMLKWNKNFKEVTKTRQEKIDKWEKQALGRSLPDLSRSRCSSQERESQPSVIPMRKNKFDNPALRLLEEDRLRKREKLMKIYEVNKSKILEEEKHIETAYEELQFNKLTRSMEITSDPELIVRKNRAYPDLAGSDYDYVSYRRAKLPPPPNMTDSDTDSDSSWNGPVPIFKGYSKEPLYDLPKNSNARELPIPLKRTRFMQGPQFSSSEEYESNIADTSPEMLRLRGGAASSEGSPTGPNPELIKEVDDYIKAKENAMEEQPAITPLQAQLQSTPTRLRPLEDSDFIAPIGSKRKKTTEELCATRYQNPGLSQSHSLGHSQEIRRLSTKLTSIVYTEKEKKRITVASANEILNIKDAMVDLIEVMIVENSILEGRLLEARVSEEASNIHRRVLLTRQQQDSTHQFPPLPEKTAKKRMDPKESTHLHCTSEAMETDDGATNQGAGPSKRVRIQDRLGKKVVNPATKLPANTTSELDTDIQTSEAEFVEVVRRKKKNRNKKKNPQSQVMADKIYNRVLSVQDLNGGATSASDTEGRSSRNRNQGSRPGSAARKDKLDKLKEIVPPRTFTVTIGENERATEVKKKLWADVLKKTDAPKVSNTRITAKGELRITPADEQTFKVLSEICKEQENIKESSTKYPMVMIKGIDTTLSPNEVAEAIARQNVGLGIPVGDPESLIKPMFRKGPRDEDTLFWVCQVKPELFRKIVDTKIYIGFSCCRVVEFFDYLQCSGCQKFGHREPNCKEDKLVCSYCGEVGHKESVCTHKDRQPKCANCKGPHTTYFARCKDRINAINRVVRFTCYQ